jgi:hypothetical protein
MLKPKQPMKDSRPIIAGLIAGLVAAACILWGGHTGARQVKEHAVIKGHAEWVADQSGRAVFKWKEAK